MNVRVGWRTWPNLISALRLLLLPVVVLLLAQHRFAPAFAVATVMFASDFADGALARRTGSVSRFGTVLDPLADRLACIAFAVGLVLGDALPLAYVLLLIVPEIGFSIAAWVYFRAVPTFPVTWVGKARTALLFVGFLVLTVGAGLQQAGTAPPYAELSAGIGATLMILGLLGHYVAAVQYAKQMVARRT